MGSTFRRQPRRRPGIVARLPGALLAGAALAGCASIEEGEAPQFDVCRTQLVNHVREVFSQEVTDITFYYVYDRSQLRLFHYSRAIVEVAQCPGYHFFEVRATAETCEMLPHYGQQPNYLLYRSSGDGC